MHDKCLPYGDVKSNRMIFIDRTEYHNPPWWFFFLIFHTVIIINSKNWRTTIKLHFENLSIFLKKTERTHILGPLLPLFIFVCFSMTPTPLLNECTFWMTPLKEVENISLPWYYIYTSFSPQYLPHFSWTLWFSLMVKKTNAAVKTMESGDAP